MTKQNNQTVPHPILGTFEPIEDLLYHDRPYVFTFRDAQGGLAIAYLSAADDQSSHYLAVPIKETELSDLKKGTLALRRVFRDWAWDIMLDANANFLSVRQRVIDELAADALPPVDLHL